MGDDSVAHEKARLATENHFEMEIKPEAKPKKKSRCDGCRQGCQAFTQGCAEIREACGPFSCKECMKDCCSVETAKKRLPILRWLPKYRLPELQGDLIAGLTVGLTVIPQGIAYAQVAELPPQYGLYSAFMGCFIYCLMGTAKDITLGPTAIMSLMVAEFASSPVHGDATVAIVLTLFCGIIQVAMGFLNIGFLVEYISHPVINSFTTSAAITIAFGQIKKWLGLSGVPRHFLQQFYWTFKKLPETKLWDFVLGLICMIMLIGMKKMKNIQWNEERRVPLPLIILRKTIWLFGTARNAIVVILAAAVAAIFYKHDMEPFSLTGNITAGLPPFKPPSFTIQDGNHTIPAGEVFARIGSGFALIPIIGLVETIAIGKAFARKNKYKIDANQELIAIGLSNVVGCFVSSYPVTGSFSRTAVNSQSGVRTPAGGIFTGALVLLSLGLLTPLFYYIPSSALAGVIIVAVLDMVDFSLICSLWKVKKLDLVPWVTTFIFSFVLGIEWGILIGVGVSLLLLLYPFAKPGMQVTQGEASALMRVTEDPAADKDPVSQEQVVIIKFEEGLHFPGIEYVKNRVWDESFDSETGRAKSVILDMTHLSNVDYTSAHGWQSVITDLDLNDQACIFTNLRPSVLDIFKRCNLTKFRYADSNEEAIRSIYEENEPGEPNPRQSLLGNSTNRLSQASEDKYGATEHNAPHNMTDDGSLHLQVGPEEDSNA